MNQHITKKKFLSLLISVLMIGMMLSGCGSIPESWGTPNPDYLTLIDASSCWYGICPGQTMLEEAEQILQSIPFGEENGIEKTELENSITLLLDDQRFEGSKVIVEFDEVGQIVKSIEIIPWKKELTMNQVVDLLGEPQEVIMTTHSIGDSAADFPNYQIWYPELGLSVWSGIYNAGVNPQLDEMVLHPTLAVASLKYIGKKRGREYLLEDLMTRLFPYQRPKDKKELEKFFHPWPGFGNSVPSVLGYMKFPP